MKKSTTPRTDKAEKLIARGKIVTIRVEFAKKLEKEINTLKKRIINQESAAKVSVENRLIKHRLANCIHDLAKRDIEVDTLTSALHARAREATEQHNLHNEEIRRIHNDEIQRLNSETLTTSHPPDTHHSL